MLLLAGCGRVGFEAGDAGTTAIPDALFDGTPTLITELSQPGSDEDHAALTSDLREIYFASDRLGGDFDIYVATRTDVDAPWTAPVRVAELSSSSIDQGVGLSSDGLTIYLTSGRPGGAGMTDVWVATRPDRDSPWSTPANVTELNSADSQHAPKLDAEGTTIMFESQGDIYRATRPDAASTWAAPQRVDDLSMPDPIYDGDPMLVAGGYVIVFDSSRSGFGVLELYIASRGSLTAPFDAPDRLPQFGAAADPWMSEDMRYLVFRRPPDGRKDNDLWEVRL